MKTTTLIMNI